MRVIVYSSLLITLSMFSVVRAEGNLDAATKQQLIKLEQKYFGHSYESEPEERRASRLEQLIFGEDNTGTAAERIHKIVAISPVEDPLPAATDSPAARPAQKKTAVSATKTQSKASGSTPAAGKDSSHSLIDEDSVELRDYPHISALEKSILGKTFVGQPLSARLARLESKAFGTPSMLVDFSQRTDALEDFAEKNLKQKPFGSEENLETAQSQSSAPAAGTSQAAAELQTSPKNQADYPHITSLEKNILGTTYAGQEISSRLSRLETTAFGKPSDSPDMSQRTDALDRFADKKLHKKPFAEQQKDTETASARTNLPGQQSSPGMPAKALAMVANTLLSATGMGMGPMGPMGPMGMGRGMPGGFPGARFGQRQPAPQATPVDAEEDPALFTFAPPGHDAKLLTKVGWCEVKTFGHTFQTLHLTDRLRQLSRQLEFDSNKTDLELMDDIGALIKVVQLRQTKDARPIGASPQAAVQ